MCILCEKKKKVPFENRCCSPFTLILYYILLSLPPSLSVSLFMCVFVSLSLDCLSDHTTFPNVAVPILACIKADYLAAEA